MAAANFSLFTFHFSFFTIPFSPSGVLREHIARLQNLALRNGEEIHLVTPLTGLHGLDCLREGAVGILGDLQTTNIGEVLVSLFPAAHVEEAMSLESQLHEALILILLLEVGSTEACGQIGQTGTLTNLIDVVGCSGSAKS